MRKIRQSELPCIRTYEPYWHLARAVLGFATLETVPIFIFIILNAGVTFQHKTLLNRSMFNLGKDFLQIAQGYNFFERGYCMQIIFLLNFGAEPDYYQ